MAVAEFQNYRTRVVFDGQSLNNVPGDGFGGYENPYQSMPYRIMADLDPPAAFQVVAINGTSWTDLVPTRVTRCFSLVRTRAGKRDILFMQGGQSDITTTADTGATIHADMVEYADAARAAGFDAVIASTIPKFNPFGVTLPGSMETARTTANALILADTANDFDAVVDFAVAPLHNPADGIHYIPGIDQTHWTPRGASVAADLARAAVQSLVLA